MISMALRPRLISALAALLFLALAQWESSAFAQEGMCRIVDTDFTPAEGLQIVVWVETETGDFVDTTFITQTTGSYGLGNRPGIFTFNSGPLWPYGRRETTFPVWAARHGMDWPLIVFQDGNDQNLSHSLSQSSLESHFCRPIKKNEPLWDDTMDTMSCATRAFTDKGTFDAVRTSKYPPRDDLARVAGKDDDSVAQMASMNPFDAVSKATPLGGANTTLQWRVPKDLPFGNYVLWVEVSQENDMNASYDFEEPQGIPWSDHGTRYRGQPSVVYRVPFEMTGESDMTNVAAGYFGYGDPGPLLFGTRAIDGLIRPPDATISQNSGSGAGRLQLTAGDGDEMYRVRVRARTEYDAVAPGGAGQFESTQTSATAAELRFIAPGDDDQDGMVSGYEVRFLAGRTITDENWNEGTPVSVGLTPEVAGSVHEFSLEGLLPATNYSVGIRATDECLNEGPVIAANVTTPRGEADSVGYCFVATAAFGSQSATEVVALRAFRDRILRRTVLGELAVAGYYTFGPLFAGAIGESEDLRRAARGLLAPLVDYAASRVEQ